MKLQSTTQPDNTVHIVLTLGQHNALLTTIDTCSEALHALGPAGKEVDDKTGKVCNPLSAAFAALREINLAINATDVPCISAAVPKPKPEDPADE